MEDIGNHLLISDYDLVELLRKGNTSAFEIIYCRYSRVLLSYVADQINEREDCEEMIQDSFVWLWTHRNRLPEIIELRAYLYGIVRHKIFNYIRAKAIRRNYAVKCKALNAQFCTQTQEQVDLADTVVILKNVINKLPKRCREAFLLSREKLKSTKQISTQMNISERTVENYMTYAKAVLRKHVAAFYKPV